MVDLDRDVTSAPAGVEAGDDEPHPWYRGMRLTVAVIVVGVALLAVGVVGIVSGRSADRDADVFTADTGAAAARLVDLQGEVEAERAALDDARAELAGIEERLSAMQAETTQLLATTDAIEQQSADAGAALAVIADEAESLTASIDAVLAKTEAAVNADGAVAGHLSDAVAAGNRRDLGAMSTHLENGRSALDSIRAALDELETASSSLEAEISKVGSSLAGGGDGS